MKRLVVMVTAALVMAVVMSASAVAAPAVANPQSGDQGAGCQGLAEAIMKQDQNRGKVKGVLVQQYLANGCAPGADSARWEICIVYICVGGGSGSYPCYSKPDGTVGYCD